MRPTPRIALALTIALAMVLHVVDAAHGAALVEQHQFVILTRSATRKSSLGVGRIELISMMRWIISSVTAISLAAALPYSASASYEVCIPEEVI